MAQDILRNEWVVNLHINYKICRSCETFKDKYLKETLGNYDYKDKWQTKHIMSYRTVYRACLVALEPRICLRATSSMKHKYNHLRITASEWEFLNEDRLLVIIVRRFLLSLSDSLESSLNWILLLCRGNISLTFIMLTLWIWRGIIGGLSNSSNPWESVLA